TYQTAWEAVRLCLGAAVAADLSGENNRDRLMAEYQRLMHEGRIDFVTFHQSMSYEEFVEGLRPGHQGDATSGRKVDGNVGFRLIPHDGVFKRLCLLARQDVIKSSHSGQRTQLDLT